LLDNSLLNDFSLLRVRTIRNPLLSKGEADKLRQQCRVVIKEANSEARSS
jgi:hypothetical protein